MPPRDRPIDDDAVPVMVPRSERKLVPIPPARVQRLREHLDWISRVSTESAAALQVRPEPDGFAAQVVRTACTLCRGWCCRNGADDAFLDERTIARMRQQHAEPIPQRYLDRLPPESYDGSCIFHGRQGCTLDRSMRSDVCNAYFCGGLQSYLAGGDPPAPTVVIAGEGETMRTSPVLLPGRRKG